MNAPMPWWLHRWPIAAVLALVPLWSVGLFTRGAWAPAESRELVHCAGLLEHPQPTLTTWLGTAGLHLFGPSASAARVGNLLYALIGSLAVGLLAAALVRRSRPEDLRAAAVAGLVAAIASGSMWFTWRAQVQLGADAPLLCGVCLALLGAWRALEAGSWRERLGWWLVFHTGVLLSLLAQQLVGVVGPIVAVLLFCLWQRRWRELLRWELHLGWLAQVVPWVISRAQSPEAFALAGQDGQAGSPGEFLAGLPLLLAPWTLLAFAALVRLGSAAWHGCDRAARFLVMALVPMVVLLPIIGTAGGNAVVMWMPVAAAIGWWWSAGRWNRADWLAIDLTLVTVGAVMAIVPLAVGGLPWLLGEEAWRLALIAGLVESALFAWVVWLLWRRRGAGHPSAALALAGIGLGLVLITGALRVAPRVDPWHDLRPTCERIRQATKLVPVVLYRADETITANLAWHVGLHLPEADDVLGAAKLAEADPHTLLVVTLDHDRITPAMRQRLTWLAEATGLRFLQPRPPAGDGWRAEELTAAGFTCFARLEIPAGRRYGLFCRADSPLLDAKPIP